MGEPMTAAQLIEHLHQLPPDTPVLVSGYEGGMTAAGFSTVQAQQLDRHGEMDWLGDFETPEEAARQAAQHADDPWIPIRDFEPPTLVGEPFTCGFIYRITR